MVHVTLADSSSSVTVGSATVTGPLSFWASEVTHSATEYDSGILVVQAGSAVQTPEIAPVHAIAWPYAVFLAIALAFLTGNRR